MQWSRIKSFEKNKWSRAPNVPIRSSGDPNFIIAKVSNLPIASLKCPQINVPLRHQEPNFPFTSSGHLAPQFPHCFIKGFQLPYCIIKGQRALNFPLHHQGSPISSSCHQNCNLLFPITLSRVPSHHCVIKGPALWPLISHHVIKGSHLSLRHQGSPFPATRHQRDPNFQNTPWDMY